MPLVIKDDDDNIIQVAKGSPDGVLIFIDNEDGLCINLNLSFEDAIIFIDLINENIVTELK